MPGVGKGQVAAGRTGAGAEGANVVAAGAAAGLATTAAGFFAAGFFATAFLAAGLAAGFLAATFLAAGFLAATFLAAGFLAATFLAAGFLAATFLAAGFLAATFLAAGFLAATFLAAGFLAATFLAAGFLAATFLAAGFLAATFLAAGFFAAAFFAAGLAFFAATISTSLVVKVNKKTIFQLDNYTSNTPQSGMNEALAQRPPRLPLQTQFNSELQMTRLALLFTVNRMTNLTVRYPHSSHQQTSLHPEMHKSGRINCREQQLKKMARTSTQGIADLHAQMTALCGQISQFCIGGFCGGWEALRSTLECNFGWQIRFSK